MITGYNTDVLFEGTVFHVQSEDRGSENPILDTLIYCGGRILAQIKTGYSEDLGPDPEDRDVARLLEAQHRHYVRQARQGQFAEHRPTVGEVLENESELVAAVMQSLAEDDETELLELTFERAGHGLPLRGELRVARAADGGPAGRARSMDRLVGERLRSATVLDDETDDEGSLSLAVAIPAGGASAIIFSAERAGGGGRLRVSL